MIEQVCSGQLIRRGEAVDFWESDDVAIEAIVVDVLERHSHSPLGLFIRDDFGYRFIPCAPAVRPDHGRRGRWSRREPVDNPGT